MTSHLSLLLVACVLCAFIVPNITSQDSPAENHEDPSLQPVFTSLGQVLDLLESEQYQDNLDVQQLLHVYFHSCQSKRISYLPKPTRRPFVVVEGNHRTAKRMLSMRLSRRLGASWLPNPARCLTHLRKFFTKNSLLLRAFFKLSAYAIAQNTRRLINIFPIVTNGYWLDQHTYAMARTYGMNPPPVGHPIYQWPKDLLHPDIIFYVEFPDNLHSNTGTTRAPNSLKTLAFNALLKMNVSEMYIINTTLGVDAALEEMERRLEERLGPKFPIQLQNVTKGPQRFHLNHLKNIRIKQN